MLSGSMSIAELPKSAPSHWETFDSVLIIGIPSTTNRGWLFPKELLPRITIREEEPTAPVALVI